MSQSSSHSFGGDLINIAQQYFCQEYKQTKFHSLIFGDFCGLGYLIPMYESLNIPIVGFLVGYVKGKKLV